MSSHIYISKPPFADPSFTVSDQKGNDVPFKLRRVYLRHIFFLLNEMRLQYLAYCPSFFSLLALAIKYQMTLMARNPKLGIFEMFVSFQIVIPHKENVDFPLSILPSSGSEVWVSRMSALSNVSTQNLSTEIEWNRVRFSDNFVLFIWSSQPNAHQSKAKEKFLSETSCLEITTPLHLAPYEDDAMSLRKLSNVTVVSALFVIDGEDIHFLDKYNFKDETSWPTNLIFGSGTDNAILINSAKLLDHVENAVLFGSNSSWFHFLVEIFPRYLHYFDSYHDVYRNSTLLVRGSLPKSILEVLNLLGFLNILHINDAESFQVNNLLVTRDFRHNNVTDLSLRADDLVRVRNYLLKSCTPTTGPKLVYVRRANRLFRPLSNRKALDGLLMELGFETVDLESKGVSDQVNIFRSADVIVSESGAALTNIIFMKTGSKVFEIHPGNDLAGLWASLGSVFNVSVTVFYGEQNYLRNRVFGFGSYRVNIKNLKKSLLELVKN